MNHRMRQAPATGAGGSPAPEKAASGAIERRFRAALLTSTLIPPGSCVLVGVSGGPDSSALLLLLHKYSGSLGYRCEAAYFDHQIRPAAERAAELKTVKLLTQSLTVPLHTSSAPVLEQARLRKRSIEEQARIERYRFLGEVASERSASIVAVGHTADDQAETILLHILRGTGLRGLAGMAGNRPWPYGTGPRLIRPLLGFRRAETEAYCIARHVTPFSDSQNASAKYTRNRIRHELLPALLRFNPRVSEALVRLGEVAAQQLELLTEITTERLSSPSTRVALLLLRQDQDERRGYLPTALSSDVLQRLPVAVLSELLAEEYARVAGSRRGLSARHLASVTALLKSKGEHRLDLPAGVQVRLSGDALSFQRLASPSAAGLEKGSAYPETIEGREVPLSVPGTVRFGDWEISTGLVEPGCVCEPGELRAVIAATDAAAGLTVRSRRPGDRMRPAGMIGSKKVQDIFVDAKVPRSARDSIPLVCIGDEVVWVVGLRAASRTTVRDESLARIALSARRLDAP